MNFPSQALLVLLKFARGKIELNEEVIDAGMEVLQYCFHLIMEKIDAKSDSEPKEIEEVLETALAEGTGEAKAFTPGIWVTIAIFVVEQILKKYLNK